MKTTNKIITFIMLPLLVSCNSIPSDINDSSSAENNYFTDENGITLEIDHEEDYVLDANVTNEFGSMGYEIFVRSFYDSNNDGIGDLNGVKEKIPYLASLGIKTVWLMPIMPSPTYHGYDTTNYFNVNKDYGTIDDFKSLVATANQYNIDIMLDMVLNHCSKNHAYFIKSYNDYVSNNQSEDSKADWFNWGDSGDASYNGVFYEARFDSSMPDFNLDCLALRQEIDKIFKFWIQDCGVKGFRLDAVLYYYYQNTSKNIEFMNFLMETAHKYDPEFYMVGECWQSDVVLNSYTSSSLNSFFRFGQASGGDLSLINLIKGYGKANNYAETIEKNEALCKTRNPNYYSSYFLSNHDQDRISKNFNETQNKIAISLYGLLPGMPFMYYGEEIALKGKRVTSPEDFSDVRRRLPLIWSKEDKTGQCEFPEKTRPDLKYNEQVELGIEDQLNQNYSLLKHYQKVINVRNKYPFMKDGIFINMTPSLNTQDTGIMAYKIMLDDEYVIVVHNFRPYALVVDAPGNTIVDEINTVQLKPNINEGKLTIAAQSTVLLK